MSIVRNRAWRIFKKSVNKSKGQGSDQLWKPEKQWKNLYLRSIKLARAKQLKFEYPRRTMKQVLERELPTDE